MATIDNDTREKELTALLTQLGIQPNSLTPSQRAGALAALSNEGIDIIPTPVFVIKSLCLSVSSSSNTATNNSVPGGNPGSTARPSESGIPKSFRVPDGKVFINVCSHDHIPPPKTAPKSESSSSSSSSTDDQPAVSIPIAVGPVKSDTDKDGHTVLVIDMIVHPSVTKDCERDGSGAFRHWLCQLAIQYLYKKHNILVNNQYRLPLLKYKGNTVTSQRVRKPNPSATGIQEVRPTTVSSPHNDPKKSSLSSSTSSPSSAKKTNTDSSTSSPSSSNLETVTPLSLIAEAGGLPSISTALGPVQKGGASHAAPQRSPRHPMVPSETIQMDIRVVGKDTDDKDLHARINEDMQKQAKDQYPNGSSSASLHIAKDSQGRPLTSPSNTSGLQQLKTTRIYKPLLPIITIDILTRSKNGNVINDDNDEENRGENVGTRATERTVTHACTLVADTVPSSTTTTAETDTLTYRMELPPTLPLNDSSSPSFFRSLSFSFTFPEPNNSDQLAVRLNQKNIKIVMNGNGDTLTLTAEGYRKCIIHLPLRCTMVTEEIRNNVSDTNETKEERVRVISSVYDTDFRMLTLTLPIYTNPTVTLPRLPSIYEDTPYIRDILRQYVEADANHFEPDPGSKPWMLAQALAVSSSDHPSTDEKKEFSSSSSSKTGLSSSTRPLDDDTPVRDDEELPEDAFLRSDALSLHFLRQREEDAKRRQEKETERSQQRNNQAYTEIIEDYSSKDPTDNPGALTNIGSTNSSAAVPVATSSTIVKTIPDGSSSSSSSVAASESVAVDPALLYDIL